MTYAGFDRTATVQSHHPPYTEGSLLLFHRLLMTEAGAIALGHAWLRENADRRTPLWVGYKDVEGKDQVAVIE